MVLLDNAGAYCPEQPDDKGSALHKYPSATHFLQNHSHFAMQFRFVLLIVDTNTHKSLFYFNNLKWHGICIIKVSHIKKKVINMNAVIFANNRIISMYIGRAIFLNKKVMESTLENLCLINPKVIESKAKDVSPSNVSVMENTMNNALAMNHPAPKLFA